MYTKELITRPDGSKYVRCVRIPEPETRSIEELEDMYRMSRAIEAFGTSS